MVQERIRVLNTEGKFSGAHVRKFLGGWLKFPSGQASHIGKGSSLSVGDPEVQSSAD